MVDNLKQNTNEHATERMAVNVPARMVAAAVNPPQRSKIVYTALIGAVLIVVSYVAWLGGVNPFVSTADGAAALASILGVMALGAIWIERTFFTAV